MLDLCCLPCVKLRLQDSLHAIRYIGAKKNELLLQFADIAGLSLARRH